MPINQIEAFVVLCDLCHRPLIVPNPAYSHKPFQVDSFPTRDLAQAAAHLASWTVGRELTACPKCSPITDPAPTQTPAGADVTRAGFPGRAAGS